MMNQKVILVVVDGMRPDGFLRCGHPYVRTLLTQSAHALDAQTVMPSVTLPCHVSLFHSVPPSRHGTITNRYAEQVRPVNGLCEQLHAAGKKNALFYTWEPLRDLTRPESLAAAALYNLHAAPDTDTRITDAAIVYINSDAPDFLFLYLGETDEVGGHDQGWMSTTYLGCIKKAIGCVQRLRENIDASYNVILVADHGGHERSHGTDLPEDMTIPVICVGPSFTPGVLKDVTILDIAPTIAKLCGALPAREWEGHPLV